MTTTKPANERDAGISVLATANPCHRFSVSSQELVIVEGKDAARFVHRLSTNDSESLDDGAGILNAFTDKKGRLRHVAHQWMRDGAVYLYEDGGDARALLAWLDAFHFAESLTLKRVQAVVAGIVGDGAEAILMETMGAAPPEPFDVVTTAETVAIRTFDAVNPDLRPTSMFIVVNPPAAILALPVIDADVVNTLRIAAGVPRIPSEIGDHVNPLEIGLKQIVSFDKGCFTGQEVIARIDNLDKLSRHLVSLVVNEPVAVGAKVFLRKSETTTSSDDHSDAHVGEVTSVAPHQVQSKYRAMALIRLRTPPYGAVVDVGDDERKTGAVMERRTTVHGAH